MKQLLLIVNPTSGTKKASKRLAEIVAVFNKQDYDVHVYMTSCRSDATKIVERIGAQMDIIVCCGGDGTLNETITGIIESDLNIPIGYIPAGSTNDFANSLHLSHDIVEAADQIVQGSANLYDVGQFKNRYFTYVASFGAFTKTSYTTPQSIKNALGHMAYILEGISEISKIKNEHIKIELDGEVIEDDYIFGAICNSTSLGGILTLNPSLVDISDGKFEVFLIRVPKNITELHECIVAIRNQTYNCGMVTFRSASKIKIISNPDMPWSLDGEKEEGSEQIVVQNLHHKIKIVH